MGYFLKKHGASLLTFGSVVGLISTVVLTVSATRKADKCLNELDIPEDDIPETIKATWEYYIPPAVSTLVTIGCIVGSNCLNKRTQQSMAAAYALLDQSFKQYRGSLIELHGEEADREILDHIIGMNPECHEIDGDDPDIYKITVYEPISGQTKEMFQKELVDAEYHFNRNFTLHGGIATVNELLQMLGLSEIDEGDEIGWCINDGWYYWVDFKHSQITLPDGRKAWQINTIFSPYKLEDYY